ncbi:Translation factor guf1 mitochondrial [Mortierella claussenii]|nr:Translation factor guf1 mitochondrial [Mortierella claussenii]
MTGVASTLYPHSVDFTGRPPPPDGGYSWNQIKAAVESNSLHTLRRTDKGQYEYEQWQALIDRTKYNNVGEYIAFTILNWPDLQDPAEADNATGVDIGSSIEERYKSIEPRMTLRLNHFPIPVQQSIQYFVLWSTRDMSALSERARLDRYLQQQLGSTSGAISPPRQGLSPELTPLEPGKRKQWMWFVNPMELRSVATVHHIHVFVRDVTSQQMKPSSLGTVELESFGVDQIRNFSIIAHVDHGKSTLADRLLELAQTINKRKDNKQVLDKLKVERERGITVKAQSASMFYVYKGKKYLLNLIDTPGHMDFNFEVSRSLAACQGTLLLVDAAQGIQAQTVANFYLAYGQDIAIIPVINKIDLPAADPERVASQIEVAFEMPASGCLQISAKSGLNVDTILPTIIENVPSPSGDINKPFKALLFDSWHDTYVGVICLMAVIDGTVKKGDKIVSAYSERRYEVTETGIMYPEQTPTSSLQAGQVGYFVLNMKTLSESHVGDTFFDHKHIGTPMPGFVPAKPMVWAGIFPIDTADFEKLDHSVAKLTLNDSSVVVQKETSAALGQGWRLGFLGTLHMDVFRQRLEQEYDANIIITAPTVPYKIEYRDGTHKLIRNPTEFPDMDEINAKVQSVQEPMVRSTVIFPKEYLGDIMVLCGSRRGVQLEHTYLDESRVLLKYRLPLAEVVTDFHDELKGRSSGFASFDYEEDGYDDADLVKMNIMLNSKPVDALSIILHRSQAELVGRDWVKRLKGLLSRQLFEIVIQASVGTKVIAREGLSALRKNVIAKCYGGDVSRKMKLLNKQKEGKKRMKAIGGVEVSQEAFYDFMSKKK